MLAREWEEHVRAGSPEATRIRNAASHRPERAACSFRGEPQDRLSGRESLWERRFSTPYSRAHDTGAGLHSVDEAEQIPADDVIGGIRRREYRIAWSDQIGVL